MSSFPGLMIFIRNCRVLLKVVYQHISHQSNKRGKNGATPPTDWWENHEDNGKRSDRKTRRQTDTQVRIWQPAVRSFTRLMRLSNNRVVLANDEVTADDYYWWLMTIKIMTKMAMLMQVDWKEKFLHRRHFISLIVVYLHFCNYTWFLVQSVIHWS